MLADRPTTPELSPTPATSLSKLVLPLAAGSQSASTRGTSPKEMIQCRFIALTRMLNRTEIMKFMISAHVCTCPIQSIARIWGAIFRAMEPLQKRKSTSANPMGVRTAASLVIQANCGHLLSSYLA